MKRILSILASLCVSLSIWAYSFEVNGIYYSVIGNNEVAVVSKIYNGSTYSGNVVIPEHVEYNEKSYSVTAIGNEAFYGASNLISLTIPNSVISIGHSAFSWCENLTSVTIGSGVKSIDSSAFDGCNRLSFVKISDLSAWCNIQFYFQNSNPLSYAHHLILNDSEITALEIPYNVTYIQNYAFSGCYNLNSITIPNSVTSIGKEAFQDCSNLKSVTIPNSVTSIGEEAFAGCSNLKSVIIPNSVSSIKNNAFKGCPNLILKLPSEIFIDFEFGPILGVEVPKGCTTKFAKHQNWEETEIIYAVENGVKYCPVFLEEEGEKVVQMRDDAHNGIEVAETEPLSIILSGDYAPYGLILCGYSNISEQIKKDGYYSITPSIYHKKNIVRTYAYPTKEIHVSPSGTLIDQIGIENVENVLSLKVSGDLNGTDILTIRKMINLKLLDMKDANIVDGGASYYQNFVTSKDAIGDYFFKEKKNLICIELPLSITKINGCAFDGCCGLTTISIPNKVTSIGNLAFRDCCELKSINISDLAAWCNIAFNTFYHGYSYSNPLSYAHHLSINGSEINELIIPNNVTAINNYAFHNCSGLTSVTIPHSVTHIGSSAFEGCSGLTSVTIPHSVTHIDYGAFSSCSGLTSVAIGSDLRDYSGGFRDCNSITEVIFHCKKVWPWFSGKETITTVILGDEVTSIAPRAFAECRGLKTVVMGNNVTSIGDDAFSSCSGLTSVTIPSSVISIGSYAFSSCGSLTSITIPNSVTTLGDYPFEHCSSLTSVSIGSGISNISGCAFRNCINLTSVTIPNNIKTISWTAFSNCIGLTSIVIPNSVTNIGIYAFKGCSGLASVTSLNPTPPEISNETFDDYIYSNATLYVPFGCKTMYWLNPYWELFKNIVELDDTSINDNAIDPSPKSKGVYTIDGVKLSANADNIENLRKGIYIINGEKVIIK